MNDHFDHYKRAPSRDRSRDPSMDRYSRSSRQQSAVRQMVDLTSSRGPSPGPTPTNLIKRSVSRQRTPLSTPTPSARMGHDASFSNGSSNDSASLQRRMATPVRVFTSISSYFSFSQFLIRFIQSSALNQRIKKKKRKKKRTPVSLSLNPLNSIA